MTIKDVLTKLNAVDQVEITLVFHQLNQDIRVFAGDVEDVFKLDNAEELLELSVDKIELYNCRIELKHLTNLTYQSMGL